MPSAARSPPLELRLALFLEGGEALDVVAAVVDDAAQPLDALEPERVDRVCAFEDAQLLLHHRDCKRRVLDDVARDAIGEGTRAPRPARCG